METILESPVIDEEHRQSGAAPNTGAIEQARQMAATADFGARTARRLLSNDPMRTLANRRQQGGE